MVKKHEGPFSFVVKIFVCELSQFSTILMVSAAHVIEQLILKNLYRRLGLKFEAKAGYEFPDYIRELRR